MTTPNRDRRTDADRRLTWWSLALRVVTAASATVLAIGATLAASLREGLGLSVYVLPDLTSAVVYAIAGGIVLAALFGAVVVWLIPVYARLREPYRWPELGVALVAIAVGVILGFFVLPDEGRLIIPLLFGGLALGAWWGARNRLSAGDPPRRINAWRWVAWSFIAIGAVASIYDGAVGPTLRFGEDIVTEQNPDLTRLPGLTVLGIHPEPVCVESDLPYLATDHLYVLVLEEPNRVLLVDLAQEATNDEPRFIVDIPQRSVSVERGGAIWTLWEEASAKTTVQQQLAAFATACS